MKFNFENQKTLIRHIVNMSNMTMKMVKTIYRNGILHFLSVHPLLRTLEIQGMPFIFNPGIPVGGGQNNPGIPVGGGQNNPGIPVGGGQNKKNLHGNSGGRG